MNSKTKITFKVVASAIFMAGIFVLMPAIASACGTCSSTQANTSIIMSADSNVTVVYNGASSSWDNRFGVSSPVNRELGSKGSTSEGASFSIGRVNNGQELILYIKGPGGTWSTGPGSRNADGKGHAIVTKSGNQWSVKFEDQYNGGDCDFNDIVLTVTTTPACTANATKACVSNAVYNFDSCGVQGTLFQQCTTNQICANGQCVNVACSTNAQCGTNAYTGSPFCQGNNVYQNYITYTCNNAGTGSSYCSNNTAPQQKTVCGANQTCTNGACVNQTITCSTNSQCGTNAYVGSPFCQNNDVYQNYITYTCNNAGTGSSYCSNSTASQKKNDCTANQICTNGACTDQTINCSTNAQCGTNAYTGSPFCQGNNVYQNYITFTCNNPNTANSYCSDFTTSQQKTVCGANQTCTNGACVNQTITCSTNTECGTNAYTGSPFCQGNNVYQNYITYTCNNAGTGSSYCSNNTSSQLKTTCTDNQTCSNGSCTAQNITCSTNTECGTNAYTGSPFCQGNNVYQNYITYTCNNAGSSTSYCSNNTSSQLKTTCTGSQTCTSGSCGQNCTAHSYQQCNGNNLYWYDSCGNQQESQYCPNGCSGNACTINNNVTVQTNAATDVNGSQATLNGYLYNSGNNNNCTTYVWFQYGLTTSYGMETTHQSQNYSGSFNQIAYFTNGSTTNHFRAVAQNCSGTTVYGQDMTTYTLGTGTLTVSKTVRNLSTGSGFLSSTTASPNDTLMFMITLQATGSQDVSNVIVRDYLPANLIYNNQLVVACTTNNSNYSNCSGSNYNYTGTIAAGVNLNTIYAGQTVTVTYQTQVAAAQNFAYGSTTLTNNVSVTSLNNNNPSSSASVIVNRTAVYGASTISTGLTNNFWVDSFFLPLMLTLVGIWMWRSGMFFGIERWLDNKKKQRRGYRAERELDQRIMSIQKTERI